MILEKLKFSSQNQATIILKFNFELDPTNSWEAGETFGKGEIFRKGDPDEFWTQIKNIS